MFEGICGRDSEKLRLWLRRLGLCTYVMPQTGCQAGVPAGFLAGFPAGWRLTGTAGARAPRGARVRGATGGTRKPP